MFFLFMFVFSLGSGYKHCMESFIFSLVNPSGGEPTKLLLKGTLKQHGIYCNSEYEPTFGGGHDFTIRDGANVNTDSYSALNHIYVCSPRDTNTAFVAGNKYVAVNELEVYVFQE